jgi:hypothetical protein
MDGANASRTRVRRLVPLVLALVLWAAIGTGTADGAVGSRAHVDRLAFAPIVSSVLTRPTPVKGTDGRFHIVLAEGREAAEQKLPRASIPRQR